MTTSRDRNGAPVERPRAARPHRPPLLWLSLLSSLCFLFLCGESARAHVVPKANHDRTVQLTLSREGLTVDYHLEVEPLTAERELLRDEIARLDTDDPDSFYKIYLKHQKAALAFNLDAKLDGGPCNFVCTKSGFQDNDKYTLVLTAAWELEPGRPHSFTFREANYELDDFSALWLTLTADDSVRLANVVAPSQELMAKSGDRRGPGDGERLRKASAGVSVPDADAGPPPAAAAPPDAPTTTPTARRPARPRRRSRPRTPRRTTIRCCASSTPARV